MPELQETQEEKDYREARQLTCPACGVRGVDNPFSAGLTGTHTANIKCACGAEFEAMVTGDPEGYLRVYSTRCSKCGMARCSNCGGYVVGGQIRTTENGNEENVAHANPKDCGPIVDGKQLLNVADAMFDLQSLIGGQSTSECIRLIYDSLRHFINEQKKELDYWHAQYRSLSS